MSEFDNQIAEARARATEEADRLPGLATEFIGCCAVWAPTAWDRIIRDAVRAQPDVAKANPASLSTLKDELAELTSDATAIAERVVAPLLIHDRLTDEELVALVSGHSFGTPQVAIPRLARQKKDEEYRCLLGAIGPSLDRAGLLTEDTPVSADGRYTRGMVVPAEVSEALAAYEAGVRAVALALWKARRLETDRAAAAAESLWDDA